MLPAPLRKPSNPVHVRVRAWRGRVGLAMVASLSVLAGMTDAIGFLATGDFVSFMSGNTTRLAVAIGDGDLGMAVRLRCWRLLSAMPWGCCWGVGAGDGPCR